MKLHRAELIIALLVTLEASAATLEAPRVDYDTLPPHKALATAVDDASIFGVASSQTSDAAASLIALEQCRDRRLDPVPVCEITHVNNAAVKTARAIRAGVPATPHPLFLWSFESGAAQLYLAGSVHVMKPSLYPLPAQFDAAFARADQLVVEINTRDVDPAVVQDKFRAYAMLPDAETIDDVLRPETLTALRTQLAAQSSALSTFAAMKPAIVATQLAIVRMTSLGYLPEFGLEQHFIGNAGARPIRELETLDEQLRVLTSPTLDVQDELLLETLEQMDSIEPLIAAMVTAWLAGDDEAFRRLFDQQSGTSPSIQQFMRQLLEERNIGMADEIAQYLTQPRITFVLVGAAHLTGPEGIVALLEARGIHGRRIRSNDSI
jgi:uncharacterized protein YbaP (TraB family)